MPRSQPPSRTALFSTALSRTTPTGSQGEQRVVPGKSGRPVIEVVHPVFGYGSDGGGRRGRAQDEDRLTREKWGTVLRSPYLRQTALPDEVAPGDHDTARAILLRLEAVLDQYDGQWTKSERARLRGMKKAWAERAAGRSPIFNLRGWKKKQNWQGRGEWEAHQAALNVDKIIRDLRSVIEDGKSQSSKRSRD